MRQSLLACLLLLSVADLAAAQPVVLLVRHAERADAGMPAGGTGDPDLSPAGHARARTLASLLRDAAITAIYTSELKRTRQTAAPLAAALGIEASVVAAADSRALLQGIASATGNVLVVGHSNTIPDIIGALGVVDGVGSIAEDEYDNLFVVLRSAAPVLLRLRYSVWDGAVLR